MSEIQPSVFIWGFRLDEPVTTLTDLVLSAVCLYAFFRLSRITDKQKLHQYLRFYFLCMGISTLLGGVIGHGIFYLFSSLWKLPGWLTCIFAITLIERVSIERARKQLPRKLGNFLAWSNIIELLTIIFLTLSTMNFFFVSLQIAFGLLIVVASLNLFMYLRTRDPGAKLFLIGVGISALAVLVFISELSIHAWFNHFDLSHILLACAAFIFYTGSRAIILDTRTKPV